MKKCTDLMDTYLKILNILRTNIDTNCIIKETAEPGSLSDYHLELNGEKISKKFSRYQNLLNVRANRLNVKSAEEYIFEIITMFCNEVITTFLSTSKEQNSELIPKKCTNINI